MVQHREVSKGYSVTERGCPLSCLCLCLFLVLFPILFTTPARAQDTPAETQGAGNPRESTPSERRKAMRTVSEPFEEDEDEEEEPEAEDDKCNYPIARPEIQERSQELLRSWSCHTFRWFDSWWGDRYDFDEKAVNGLLTVGADYRQYDGFNPRLRLRVRAPLPNLTRRWDLIVGRLDEEAFVSDTQGQDNTFYNPGLINRGEEDSWLLGLGHRGKRVRSGWDYSVGVRLRTPPAPYGKVQYYFNHRFTEDTDLRFRQTFFWRRDQGFGTTSRGDLATALDDRNVMRWEGIATFSESTEGTEWYFGQTWYHLFAHRSAISLLGFARGETDAPVQLKEYGAKLIWRRPFTRRWLYLSIGPSITWPREEPEEKRELSLGFGMWIEMEFGRWHY